MKLHLTGSRNQCPGCHKYFNSNSAFDKHRTGTPGKDRHCRTTEEMEALGMFVNADGFWVTEMHTRVGFVKEAAATAASREATEGCREGTPTGAQQHSQGFPTETLGNTTRSNNAA